MKRKLFILASMLFTLTVGAQTVNVHLKNGTVVTYQASEFDYIDFTASQSPVAYTTCPDNNHPHLIDLGLPSGTLWACCNVGAHAPEEYGGYFAWGETTEKSWYDWSTYKWSDASQKLTKYNTDSSYDIVDGKTTLEPSDDAATANWGAPWHMPSGTQIEELLVKCTSTWTSVNGVIGRKFVGPNGGAVFLPAAGYRLNGGLRYAGSDGSYWSSTLGESYPDRACGLFFGSGNAYWYYDYRSYGQSVRPVRGEDVTIKVTYDLTEKHYVGYADKVEFNTTILQLRTEMYTALYSSVGLTYDPSLPNPLLLVPATDETKMLNALDATFARLKDTDLKGGAYLLTLRKDGLTLRTYNFGEEISADGVRYAISFENAKLNSDKFWIGDETGTKTEGSYGPTWACTYTEGPATVNMTYGGSYWSGFAISACTGKTFASYSGTDQYNNVTGKAYKGDNFLVVQNAYGNESITFSIPVSIFGFNYTNSAVAANSILNGDAISGEKFGADDFLTCTVTGLRKDGKTVTYDIELAKDGTYVDYWKSTSGMLANFNNITKLTFSFKGSRNSEYGLNTPAFMCIDNIIVFAQE